jgi:hypothetical protein
MIPSPARATAGSRRGGDTGDTGILDGLLFRTIPAWALDALDWSLGVGLLLLLYLVPPRWRTPAADPSRGKAAGSGA